MRVVLQRVNGAKVEVEDKISGQIQRGWLVLLGVCGSDSEEDVIFLCDKIVNLRGFSDEMGKMNLSLVDIEGEILLVSQFTLYGNCMKGRRPSFVDAAEPSRADELYNFAINYLRDKNIKVATGVFGASMQVSLTNDGPVTFVIDSPRR